MPYEVKMPRLSQTTDEVKLLRWKVEQGDTVHKGDILCEVETDKTTMDVECIKDGTIACLLIDPDTVIEADTPIAILRESHETGPSLAAERSASRVKSDTAKQERTEKPGQIKASALVKNLARKRNIDLKDVSGTGPGGLITLDDMKSYENVSRESEPATDSSVSLHAAASTDVNPLPPNQLIVAKNATRSKREIPHYYLKSTVLVDGLKYFRARNRRGDGGKIAIDSFIIYAAARSLKSFPRFNGYFHNGEVVPYQSINVGFAAAAGNDLFVPVVRDADKKSIQQIDAEVSVYTAKVGTNTLETGDVRDGTFTISNLSAFGIDEFYAIINGKQPGILAVGRFRRTLDLDYKDRMSIRTACTVTGSFDHRMINGVQGAGFMRAVRHIIEKEFR